MSLFNRMIAWFKEYDDEITWFFIGVMFIEGANELGRDNYASGFFRLFISAAMWYFYMRDLKARNK